MSSVPPSRGYTHEHMGPSRTQCVLLDSIIIREHGMHATHPAISHTHHTGERPTKRGTTSRIIIRFSTVWRTHGARVAAGSLDGMEWMRMRVRMRAGSGRQSDAHRGTERARGRIESSDGFRGRSKDSNEGLERFERSIHPSIEGAFNVPFFETIVGIDGRTDER